jgi:hypothetical protein
MAVQPLAIIQGAVDEIPEAARLLPQLKERISGAAVKSESPVHQSVVAAWVGQLHKGGSATDQTALGRLQQLFLHPLDQPMPDAIIQADPLDSDVESAVDYNAFGDAYDDLAIASYQRASSNSSAVSSTSSKRSAEADVTDSGDVPSTATSHVGIWPHFSLLNHSCTPSCVHYVVGVAQHDCALLYTLQAIIGITFDTLHVMLTMPGRLAAPWWSGQCVTSQRARS